MNRREFLQTSGEVALLGALPRLATAYALPADSPGSPIALWQPGSLDIHHINTGRGNATLVVMPDGTSLLIDAGASGTRGAAMCPPRPDESRRPGEWIGRYVQRQLRATGRAKLDYALTTHLHGDHIGDVTEDCPPASRGDYQLTGISDVAQTVPVDTLIDRGYPDYEFPVKVNAATAVNYIRFVQAAVRGGMRAERARPGAADQIGLRHAVQRYPEFHVRVLAANGAIWTGKDEESRGQIPAGSIGPEDEIIAENMLSVAMRIQYGRFTYFTGGDLTCDTNYGHDPWRDVETPTARAAGPVSVATCNHHGYFDACGPEFVRSLQPRIWIPQSWHASHPAMATLANLYSTTLYPGPRDVFCLGLHPAAALACARFSDHFKSQQGHVLVRVAPGGEEYQVIVIDDGDETGRVKAAFGPYRS